MSTTVAGMLTMFSLLWTDSNGFSGSVFSFDAGTGIFVNDSFVPLHGTVAWSNVTKTTPTQIGEKIRWRVFALDAAQKWKVSFTYCFIAGSGDKPSGSLITVTDDCYDILAYDGKTLWNLDNAPQLVMTYSTFVGYHEFAWNPQMTLALAVGYNNSLISYSPTGVLTILKTGFSDSLNLISVSWNADGSSALIAGTGGTLLKYSDGTLMPLKTPVKTCCGIVRWHPSGTYALAVGGNGTVLKYNPHDDSVARVGTSYRNTLSGLGFSPDGSYALVSAAGLFFKFFDINSSLVKLSTNASVPITQEVAFSRDGSFALITAQSGGVSDLLKWDGSTVYPISSPLQNTANQIAFSPDDSYALVTTTAGSLLRVNYSSNSATLVPLTSTRLRGIDWFSSATSTLSTVTYTTTSSVITSTSSSIPLTTVESGTTQSSSQSTSSTSANSTIPEFGIWVLPILIFMVLTIALVCLNVSPSVATRTRPQELHLNPVFMWGLSGILKKEIRGTSPKPLF